MSCGCGGVQSSDKHFDQAVKEATDYAQKNKIPVAIYKENGEWKFCNAFDAYAARYPVCKVVSVDNGAAFM